MNYEELYDKVIFDMAYQICWDSISDDQRKEYLKQAEKVWNKKIQNIAVKCAEDAEKYCK